MNIEDFGDAPSLLSGYMGLPPNLSKQMQRMSMNDPKTNIKFVDNDSSTIYNNQGGLESVYDEENSPMALRDKKGPLQQKWNRIRNQSVKFKDPKKLIMMNNVIRGDRR